MKSTVGRPNKKTQKDVTNRRGIVFKPLDENNVFELVYDNIDIFKYMFESLNRINKNNMYLVISETSIKLLANSDITRCFCEIDILGTNVISFYSVINCTYTLKI